MIIKKNTIIIFKKNHLFYFIIINNMSLKLGISKTKLLSDPQIAMLYEQYKMKQAGSGHGRKMKGSGIFDGFVDFLKRSKILSKVGDVLLPVAGGLAAGLFTANPLGAAAGAAAGSSASEYLKSQGFGRRMKMHGGESGASTLAINPNGQRLGQRGGAMTYAYNGMMQQVPGTQKGYGRMTGGAGTQYGSISSEYGKIRA